MRMFPYNCFNCNGSHYRCAVKNSNCGCGGFGSDNCWEPEIVLILQNKNKKIKIDGIYDGYGRMIISNYYKNLRGSLKWSDFGMEPYSITSYNCNTKQYYNQFCIDVVPQGKNYYLADGVSIYCKSCYHS